DLEAVPQGRVHRAVGQHLAVPFGGEAHEREGDEGGIVEREQRQEQHRQIEERQIQHGVEDKPEIAFGAASAHQRVLETARRTACTDRSVTNPTAAMLAIASAAPIGQLPILANCTSITLAIITPSDPPTSVGVT